ncbi:pilus assembly protein PilM [Coraliomargarita parva]|uniref:pilus assembly protein PilM n=1 Tax=Coraliomargarita parva TaxID=3014050 RepID=UPI0022B2DE7A|nr:pilus assembly protein PilM [Coraliomargarita parva]
MSSAKRLIINCGASHVTAAVVASSGGSLQIDTFVAEQLVYDYSNDDAWLGALSDALKELCRQHKLSGKATFIIPGNQVLTKTFRIPHVEDSKRAQIIAFEAQQNIPYPLHEVVWDSQVVGDDGVETEVLFIACKSDTIDEFCRVVGQAGLTPESISAATVLDYNALQFADPALEGEVLLINVGARSTNLLFRNDDGIFVRNIALGGNALTQNIADSLGKSFPQAEEIKHRFFSGQLDYSNDDSGAKLLNSCADSFMRRMGQEITRSIVNYRRQKGGGAPKQILLSGRGALLSGLAEKLSETQKVTVEFFDPLLNVTLDGAIDIDPDVLRLQASEIIGEAARDQIADPACANLLPEAIQSEMRFSRQKPFLILAAACLAVAPWPVFLAANSKAAVYKEQVAEIQQQIPPLQSRKAQIFEYQEKAEALKASIQQVEGLVSTKTNWIQFFADLQESLALAKDVWLDGLKVQRFQPEKGTASYEVVVEGQMLVRETANGAQSIDQNTLSRRIKSLQSSFEGSEFVKATKQPKISWNQLREGLNVLPFEITLEIDTAKPL